MSWHHRIAAFLDYSLPQLRSTRRTNLAPLTAAILERRALAISRELGISRVTVRKHACVEKPPTRKLSAKNARSCWR